MNFTVLDGKIITARYVLDMVDLIEKSKNSKTTEKILLDEFQKLILQGKVTFMFLYCDNAENRLRGRVRRSAGFRRGTQRLELIPNNKWPKSRSKNQTAIRYWDFGRAAWRALRKDHYVVATSFFDEREKEWKDNPYDAGFTSDWDKIKELNKLSDYIRVDRPDTPEEERQRAKINKREQEKRNEQIKKQNKTKRNEAINYFQRN